MSVIISLVILVAIVAVAVWIIQQITFGPPILKSLLILLVVLLALMKVLPMLGVNW